MIPGLYKVILTKTKQVVGEFFIRGNKVVKASGMVKDLQGQPLDAHLQMRLWYLNNGYYKVIKPSPLAKSLAGPIDVSTVAVICGNHILCGRRRDTGKLIFPGGHADPGENPEQCAKRELWEETGINAKELKYLGSEDVVCRDGRTRKINCFVTFGNFHPTNKNDPDQEISEWIWLPAVKHSPSGSKDMLEDEHASQLHDRNNVLLRLLGISC